MSTTIKKSRGGWIIHLAVWAVILAMPFFSPQPGRPLHGGQDYSHFIPVIISFGAVFYVNYSVLVRRFLSTKQIGRFVLWNVVLITAVSLMVHLYFRFVLAPPAEHMPPRPLIDTISFAVRNTVIYIVIAGIAVAIWMTAQWYRNESRRKEMEKSQAEAELANLKNQVNPHFLFNTLNNIYSLIEIDPALAQEAVHDLSGMLRYVLYESQTPTVPLAKECAFIQEYVKLMSARLSPDVKLELSLPESPSQRQIAPLLFIPLVENAFKHGVDPEKPSYIRISLTENGNYVTCQVENSCFPKGESDHSGSGIGIANLSRRLEMLYPGRYSFEHGRVQSTYRSLLRINTSETK